MKKETKKINDLSQLNTLLSKEQYQDLWKQKKLPKIIINIQIST